MIRSNGSLSMADNRCLDVYGASCPDGNCLIADVLRAYGRAALKGRKKWITLPKRFTSSLACGMRKNLSAQSL